MQKFINTTKVGLLVCAMAAISLVQCQREEKKNMNEEQQNKEVAMQLYQEVLNQGKTDLLEKIMHDVFIDYNASGGPATGIDAFKNFLGMVGTAFPDLQVKVEDVLTDGNKVVVRLTISGTQSGVLMGNIPPSGKKATWTGIDILELNEGKITARWSERNLLGMMMQIGAIPSG